MSVSVSVCLCKHARRQAGRQAGTHDARTDGWMDGWMDGLYVMHCMYAMCVMYGMHVGR